jgi:transposase
MARDYRLVDRETPFLLPPDIREWLPAGHFALFLLDVVARLDTSALHSRSRRGGTGRQGYDPDMLLGLWLYASARGISSSRMIERACVEDVAFRVLCAQDAPDHTVLARFRAQHRDAMTELFAQVFALCIKVGMGRFGQVAIDGTKISANASLSQTRSLKTLRKLAAVELQKAEDTDLAEDEAGDDDDGQVPPEFTGTDRAARIQAAIASVEEQLQDELLTPLEAVKKKEKAAAKRLTREEAAQAALVADYAAAKAAGKTPRGRRPVPGGGRKAEIARKSWESVTRKAAKLEREYEDLAVGAPVKNRKLARRNTTDPESRVMKTRKGFIQGYNAQLAVTDDHLVMVAVLTNDPNDQGWLVPIMDEVQATLADMTQRTGRTDLRIGTLTADSGYLSDAAVQAPGPERLIAPGRGGTDQDGWNGTLTQGKTSAQLMATKLKDPANRALYGRRSATVETLNAHLKDGRGLRRFACRSKLAAQAELTMAAMVTNLTRIYNRLGTLPATA